MKSILLDTIYDSDDDQEDLIGRSICVVGSGLSKDVALTSFDGIIRAMNRDGSHEVVLDRDNSKHSFNLSGRDWKFID